ncbi:hypothetical protein EVAR_90747_1 [Eumeta japonica]|uniref:Uncharacterized protein n=1 Tax=Eumeta variegata TaxID=151549 RepID=A0A4C1ZDE2_EUMVA|nr:hypothetical protein EVAR_90747_1 [Eumeta japonica]
MHFMDNTEERLDRHQEINAAMKRAILQDLQQLLHEQHALVRLFEYFGAHAKCTERNAANMGRLTILLAMYIGSPHHMHEYTQDIMTYVWADSPAVAVALLCAHPIVQVMISNSFDRMRTGKRNRHRRRTAQTLTQKSKRDDISINQLT